MNPETKQNIQLASIIGIFPILNIAIFEWYLNKERGRSYYDIKSPVPFVVSGISSSFAFSALLGGIGYIVSKFAFKHDMTKSLKVAGIVVGSVCAFMLTFLLVDCALRSLFSGDNSQDFYGENTLSAKFKEALADTGIIIGMGTGGASLAIGALEGGMVKGIRCCFFGKG